MIRLNIIPDIIKKQMKAIDLLVGVKDIFFLLLIGVAITATALSFTKFILQRHFNNTINNNFLHASLGAYSFREVNEFNNEIKTALLIQREYKEWTSLLIRIANLGNDEVSFSSLKLATNNVIKIEGTAKNRESLITLKESLEDSDLFEKFDIPLEVLLQKKEIPFSLDLTLVKK